jgi:poly(3-hydroxybutyrate) depolymerase
VGCGSTAARASGRFTIDVAGTQREYIIKLPANYDANRPHKLLFTFHGAMYSAQTVADGGRPGSGPYYGIEAVAGGSTIFVAPQAASSWSNSSGRDLAYVDAMLARFKSELCIDTSRLFLVGFSAGAMMSIAIACAESDVFRAVAPMSGSLSLAGTCGGTHPIAYWGSHGLQDPTIEISAGRMVRDSFRMRNHCTATTTPEARPGCVSFTGCDAGYATEWCEFEGVHQPPPYAGEAIWAFINQF